MDSISNCPAEMEPLVSVLLPVRDAELWIGEAIESMLQQTYERIEVLVIDNDSQDNSMHVARKFSDHRLRLLAQPEGFLVSALNAGLRESRGLLIARQDADDYSEKVRIEEQVKTLIDNPTVQFVGSAFKRIAIDGSFLG